MKKLLLASNSASRKKMLEEAQLPFIIIQQTADESQCDWSMPLRQLLEALAVHKMNHVVMPAGAHEGEKAFVLTADTMGRDRDGAVHGKPHSRQEAIAMIKALRGSGLVGTAFCLDRKVWLHGAWHVEERIIQFVHASYIFSLPDALIDSYLDHEPDYMHISGAITIEGYGAQFLASCSGSYTAIMGLPLFEVREALQQLGFYE